jgi:hypothetical protein
LRKVLNEYDREVIASFAEDRGCRIVDDGDWPSMIYGMY